MHSSAQPNHVVPSPGAAPITSRRRSIPATGLPPVNEDRRGWGVLSFLLHVLVIVLLIWTPESLHTGVVIERPQGAGGPGPAGGGGGGHRGSGGVQEHVQYVKAAPPAPTPPPKPTPQAVVPPPVVQPKPEPVIPPQPKPIEPTPPEPKMDLKVEAAKPAEAMAPVPGVGGGTGRDGSAGSGPGSGGGVGAGIGTGRGSGTGPGTGGGNQVNYPPTPTEMFIPPLPYPERVRGFHLVAEYDIDETGKVLNFTFTPTRDGGYNHRLEEVLKSFKFRPGTKPDGTPVRMKAQITYDF
jgi:protein TonB